MMYDAKIFFFEKKRVEMYSSNSIESPKVSNTLLFQTMGTRLGCRCRHPSDNRLKFGPPQKHPICTNSFCAGTQLVVHTLDGPIVVRFDICMPASVVYILSHPFWPFQTFDTRQLAQIGQINNVVHSIPAQVFSWFASVQRQTGIAIIAT